MSELKQLVFDEIMFLSTNDKAMPKENGLRSEIAYNEVKILNSRNSSISYMLSLYDRQVYLYKQLKERQRC